MTPKSMDIQARYENERIGVNMGWTIASKKYDDVMELTAVARHIAKEITKDLNQALTILEGLNGDKTEPAIISRPS